MNSFFPVGDTEDKLALHVLLSETSIEAPQPIIIMVDKSTVIIMSRMLFKNRNDIRLKSY
jgi:hypothetical protein